MSLNFIVIQIDSWSLVIFSNKEFLPVFCILSTKDLNDILTPLTQKLYPQSGDAQPASESEDASNDENTVDAEYEEVKEEEK